MIKTEEKKVLLTMYYMGKLVEGGFVESGGPMLSVTGFDMAMDLVESGEKLDIDDVTFALEEMDMVDKNSIAAFTILIMSAQDIGIEKMNEKLKNKNDE